MAVTSAMRVIQAAFYTVLSSDSTLTSLTSVYGDVPAVILFPHVLIGHAHERPWHTMGGTTDGMGWQVIVRVHIYSQYQGDKEALRILDRVVTLLNYASLSITGYGTVICEYTMGRVLIEASKDKIETRHIPTEFTVRVHQ